MIYTTLLMLCASFGNCAPHGNDISDKKSSETCQNIRLQADRIREMLTHEDFAPVPSASRIITSTENDYKECEVLQKLGSYYNCKVMLQEDGDKIKKEIQGLIDNLQMLICSDDENMCDLSEAVCPLEIKQLPSWNKTEAFVHQVIEACLHIMQHVCPEMS